MLIMEGDHPSLSDLAPGTPPECQIIENLIKPEREQRPQKAGALVEQLEPVVPPPGVRRKLGKIAMDASSHHAAQKPISSRRLAESQLSSWAEGAGVVQPSGRWSRRRLVRVTALSALVVGAGAAAVALWPQAEEGRGPIEGAAGESETDAVKEPASEVEAAPAPDPERVGVGVAEDESVDRAQPVVTPTAPARLTVLVYPWGSVWINGKPRGAAPLKNASLKPGRYKISAGQDRPSQTRTVRLQEGQRKIIRFDLTK